MPKLYLSLGSNEGDREQLIRSAIDAIGRLIGSVAGISPLVETEPCGFESPHPFLNAALSVETTLPAIDVLERTQSIERQLGRRRKSIAGQYEDRPIDIDLLLYGDLVLTTERLTLPHPLLPERLFVLEPLAEIAPHILHPTLGKTIQTLRDELRLRLG